MTPLLSPLPELAKDATFGQVGIVVEDFDRALEAHAGRGPWQIWTYDADFVPQLEIAGQPATCAFRVALDPHAPQLEIIQPLDDRSPYAAWLERHGTGLHHLGYYVDDVAAVTASMRAAGFDVIMNGSGYGADGGGGFAYFDTTASLGYVTEAIERPGRRREPESVLP